MVNQQVPVTISIVGPGAWVIGTVRIFLQDNLLMIGAGFQEFKR